MPDSYETGNHHCVETISNHWIMMLQIMHAVATSALLNISTQSFLLSMSVSKQFPRVLPKHQVGFLKYENSFYKQVYPVAPFVIRKSAWQHVCYLSHLEHQRSHQ